MRRGFPGEEKVSLGLTRGEPAMALKGTVFKIYMSH